MSSSRRDWREAGLAAASAVFLSVVVFVIPLNHIVSSNSQELRYEPVLMRGFLYAGLAAWAFGFLIVRRLGGRIAARLWIGLPWAVLLLDVIGAALERSAVGIPTSAIVDGGVVLVVAVAAVTAPWAQLRAVAATVGTALLIQGAWAHIVFVRALPADDVLGANTSPTTDPEPPPGAPGNVYHILLDDYLGESFAYSTGADAAKRFPGFTYFTRFNTNFPRTSSSEPALIEGRLPTPGMSIEKWPANALRNGFWKDLAAAKVGVWVYPYARWMCPDYGVKCLSSFDIERDAQTAVTRRAIIDLWALRLLPGSVRRSLGARAASARGVAGEATAGYSTTSALDRIFGRGGVPGVPSGAVSALPTQYFNLKLFDQLLADEAQRPARGQYVYYHALIPHPPYIMNERCEYVANATPAPTFYWAQVGCANFMIERLARELARLGRLDDSLIIVHADHGDMEFLLNSKVKGRGLDFALDHAARRYQRPDTTYARDHTRFSQVNDGDSATWRSMAVEVFSSGLLLTKFPHSKTYTEDGRPIQLLDLGPTVLLHFGVPLDRSYAGMPISHVPPARDMFFFAHNRTFKDGFSSYRLTESGWKFVARIPTGR